MPTFTRQLPFSILVIGLLGVWTNALQAQPAPAAQPAAAPPAAATEAKPFKPEELEALAAPIALYPDSVVAQVLMASTYPLEVVQAERWAAANKALKGDALAAELNKQDWDPSVKSLIEFPQVLEMMSKQLDWTTKLGDAFIADQKAIMDAIQRLRAKAKAEGNLKDSEQQKIVVEQAPATTVVVQGAPPPPQIIKIESPSPTVVYVPTYNPAVVYGTWPYPAYPPPPPAYPPGYVASNVVSFAAGVAVGAAWGHAWGNCNWGGGDVDIDVNRNVNLNKNINRESYKTNMQSRSANVQGAKANSFAHDPSHRKGVSYRDSASAAKVGQSGNVGAGARQDYRGRTDAGGAARAGSPAQQPARTGTGADRTSPAQQPSRAGGADRAGASPSQQPANRGGAFEGADRGGSAARTSSDRGQASRSSPSPSRSSSGGGGSRGGGGGGGRR